MKDLFDFNHIDPTINEETKEIKPEDFDKEDNE